MVLGAQLRLRAVDAPAQEGRVAHLVSNARRLAAGPRRAWVSAEITTNELAPRITAHDWSLVGTSEAIEAIGTTSLGAAPIAAVGERVYWYDDGAIRSKVLGAPPERGVAVSARALELAADADAVYWLSSDGNVMRLDLGSDKPQVLSSRAGVSPGAIAIDEGYVYFTSLGDGLGAQGGVHAVPKRGGDTRTLWAGHVGVPMAASRLGVFWVDAAAGAIMVARRRL